MNIEKKVNYIHEAVSLLFSVGSGRNYTDMVEKKLDSLSFDSELSDTGTASDIRKHFLDEKGEAFSLLCTLETEVKEEFKKDWQTFLLYFGEIQQTDSSDSLGRTLLLWNDYKHTNFSSPEELSDSLLSMSDTQYCEEFSYTVQGLFNTLHDATEFRELNDDEMMLKYLISLELDNKYKLILEDFYFNRITHLNIVLPMIERSYNLLKKHEAELNRVLLDFVSYMETIIYDDTFLSTYEGQHDIVSTLPDNEYGILVTPCICLPFQRGIFVDLDRDGRPTEAYCLPIGILYGSTFLLSHSGNEAVKSLGEGDCQDILKLISEKTRYQILKEIAARPAFGNELAQKFSLTTATVSHHMNLMIRANIVTMHQKGIRIYYSSNPKELKRFFNRLRKDFL